MSYPTNAPRAIPAGKVLVAETCQPHEQAQLTVLDIKHSNHVAIRADVRLERCDPGFECAGSMMRWTNGYYAVRWTDRTGATQGNRYSADFTGFEKALARFELITKAS